MASTLETVLQQHPDLSANGFRVRGDADAAFNAWRAELAGEEGRAQVEAGRRFLSGVTRTPNKLSRSTSYGIRAVAGNWAGRYVSNGAMIAALLIEGIPIKRQELSMNCRAGISDAWLRRADAEAHRRTQARLS